MIVQLCIASAANLFARHNRDSIVANEILKQSNRVDNLIVNIDRPTVSIYPCGMAFKFFDKWLVNGLRNQGVGIEQYSRGLCKVDACYCENKLVCANEKIEVK